MSLQKRILYPSSTVQGWVLNYCMPNECMDTAGVAARVDYQTNDLPPLIAHPSDIAMYVLQLHSDTWSL